MKLSPKILFAGPISKLPTSGEIAEVKRRIYELHLVLGDAFCRALGRPRSAVQSVGVVNSLAQTLDCFSAKATIPVCAAHLEQYGWQCQPPVHGQGRCVHEIECKCGYKPNKPMWAHDAYWCPQCDIWLEPPCTDPTCTFCPNRPKKPSMVHDRRDISEFIDARFDRDQSGEFISPFAPERKDSAVA